MVRDRGRRMMQRLAGVAVLLTATGGLYAGMGSIAQADEFRLQDASGQVLRNVDIRIRRSGSQSWNLQTTDGLGQIFVPYSGRFEVYQVMYPARSQTFADVETGTLLVRGQPTMQSVQLK